LLDNAVRHATSTVAVRLNESDDEARLQVADDGPGIDESDRVLVFERFARLDDARARDTGGTGLGLAIVYEVVRAHGGSIDVTNHTGACFTVRLPRRALG
jgi:signal transduction histidine kinase